MPILFNLESSDIPAGNPLLQFQYTRFEKSDFLKCINSINSCCGESSIPEISVSILLDNLWSNIEREVREAILKNTIEVDHSKGSDIVTDREVLEEVLQEIRNQTTLITRVPKIRNPGYINPRAISDVGVSYENVIKHLEEYVIDQSVESLENISSGLVELERPIKYLLEVMKKNNGQIELQLNQSKQPTTSISAIDGQVTLLPEERPSLQGMHALAKALSGRKINPQE